MNAMLIVLFVMVALIGVAVTVILTLMAAKAVQNKRAADAAITAFGITAMITSMVADFVHKDVSMRQGSRLNNMVDRIFGVMENKANETTPPNNDNNIWQEQQDQIDELQRKLRQMHGDKAPNKPNKPYKH